MTNTSAVLSWSPPVNDGGRPLSEIFYTITATGEWHSYEAHSWPIYLDCHNDPPLYLPCRYMGKGPISLLQLNIIGFTIQLYLLIVSGTLMRHILGQLT